ncbi:hypothetical protein D3C71_2053800 [compost metagenome]
MAICICGSKKHSALRPCDLTWYIAMSACLSRSTVGCSAPPISVAPMLGVLWWVMLPRV